MADKFKTVVRRARFAYSSYTAQEMQGFGQVLADAIKARIQSGQNIYDQPAAPLKVGEKGYSSYARQKQRLGLKPIRDWTFTGFTLSCLKVLTCDVNHAVIGFLRGPTHPKPWKTGRPGYTASNIAAFNNAREQQWGVSPRDRATAVNAIANARPVVTVKSEAA